MTPFDRLRELRDFIRDEIDVENHPPTYHGTQRIIAYKRVLARLEVIITECVKVQREFNFFDRIETEVGGTMNDDVETEVTRQKLEVVLDQMNVEALKRVHVKFFAGTLAIEVNFKRRFPAEWQAYEKEFYGEDNELP